MTFSRMEAAMEDAFVEWFNTFECKSHAIDTVVELADGVVLSDILTDVDGKWFKQIPNQTDTQLTWVHRLNNQKIVYKLITRYFEEVLGQDPELLPTVDLSAIAKNADLHQLLLMCQMVIAIAVQSDNNHRYIEMIQSLSQKSQQALMVSIEEVMNHFNTDEINHRSSQLSSVSGTTASRSFYNDSDLTLKGQLELEKLLMEKKQFEAAHSQLLTDYDDLRERFEDLLDEKADLQHRLRDMDSVIAHANDTGKTDLVMRAELDHIKQDLAKSEDKRHEMEQILEEHVNAIHELKRKIDELSAKADEANLLRDQLEEYQQTMERLQKMETALEKYKRKADESVDLRRHIKALEEQNTSLLERSHHVEDEYRKVLAFKTLMDSYKEQVQQLESSNLEILKEKNRLDTQVARLAEQCTYLENERDRNAEQVQLLEDHVKELELVGDGTTLDKVVSHQGSVNIGEDDDGNIDQHTGDAMDLDIQNDMEENLKKSNVTELRLTIGRLKRQIKEMENNRPPDTNSTNSVQELQNAKESLEKKHEAILSERDQLRQELAQIRNGIPDSLLNQTQTIMAFRSRILDLEKESAYLKTQSTQLEKTVTQGTSSVAKDPITFQQYEKEHGCLQERLNRLEDITKMQLHDINRMLVEANYLNGINNQPSENLGQPGIDDLEVIKEQNASLQIHVLHLHEEINETQGKTRKVRDMIKLYGQLLQEMTARFALGRQSEEPSTFLSRTPRSKEEEQDLLKKQIHDVRLQSRREQQLIISAWYDLARRNHREMSNLSIRSTPSSWLGRQRKILDGHLRQKLC
ncbi:HOOK protein-domain-containing protein [Chlamydoabsidia padenii]|nr:HOOK protein-domain-containing protein [Chlamydoabsidia padenii]